MTSTKTERRSSACKPRGGGAAPANSEAQAKRNAERAAKATEKAQHEPAKLSGDEKFLCEAIERLNASESSPLG